jgi:hypothetical protein
MTGLFPINVPFLFSTFTSKFAIGNPLCHDEKEDLE